MPDYLTRQAIELTTLSCAYQELHQTTRNRSSHTMTMTTIDTVPLVRYLEIMRNPHKVSPLVYPIGFDDMRRVVLSEKCSQQALEAILSALDFSLDVENSSDMLEPLVTTTWPRIHKWCETADSNEGIETQTVLDRWFIISFLMSRFADMGISPTELSLIDDLPSQWYGSLPAHALSLSKGDRDTSIACTGINTYVPAIIGGIDGYNH